MEGCPQGGQKSDTGWRAKLADMMVEELKLTSETAIRPVERGMLVSLVGKGVVYGKEVGNTHAQVWVTPFCRT